MLHFFSSSLKASFARDAALGASCFVSTLRGECVLRGYFPVFWLLLLAESSAVRRCRAFVSDLTSLSGHLSFSAACLVVDLCSFNHPWCVCVPLSAHSGFSPVPGVCEHSVLILTPTLLAPVWSPCLSPLTSLISLFPWIISSGLSSNYLFSILQQFNLSIKVYFYYREITQAL